MKVFTVEVLDHDDRHWIAAEDAETAIQCAIDEELEEESDRDMIVATELSEAEIDKEEITLVDEKGKQSTIPMRSRLNFVVEQKKKFDLLASTTIYEH